MFIRLELCETELTGLAALDKRRSLGLADGENLVITTSKHQMGAFAPTLEIDEAFARAYFAPEQTQSTAHAPLALLTPGDLVLLPNGYSATFAENLDAARIRELYVAVRFAGLQQEVARLSAELEEAKNITATIDG